MIQELKPQEFKQMEITDNDRVIRLNPYQDGFIFTDVRFPCLVAAWGTGKTMCGIERGRLASESYPKNLGLVIRKEFTDLKDSTIKDWELYTGTKLNSGRDSVFPNGSTVMFRHGEELTGDNLNNMNLGWFLIEQGEEYLTDDVFFKLQGRLRRQGVPHWGAVIANTRGHNWIYKLWKSSPSEGYQLFEATTYDNAHNLPKDFVQSLETLKVKKPKVYNRFVVNSWDEEDVTDVIILPEWVRKAINKPIFINPQEIRRVISIDVARFGDDKTTFYAIENGRLVAREEHDKISTMETVGRAQIFANKYLQTENFAVDEIGVGGGVVDRLTELGKNVIAVNGAKKSTNPNCYNVRAEVYSYGAEVFENGNVSITQDDIQLQEQLSWAKYKEIKSSGMFQVEQKEDIKKRYGRSPDNADAFLNGLWALQFVPVATERTEVVRGWVHPRFRRQGAFV